MEEIEMRFWSILLENDPHREFQDQLKERENKLKSLQTTISNEVKNLLYKDRDGLERLWSLNDRIYCELEKLEQRSLKRSVDELRELNEADVLNSGTFDYGEYIRASVTLYSNKVSLYLKEKIWGFNEDNGNIEAGNFLHPSIPEDNSLTYKDFMWYMRDNVLTVHPRYHVALLLLCNSYLSSQIKNTTAPFENFQWDKTTYYTPPQPQILTFGEAYDKFFPVIADITKFTSCWFFTLVLIWAVNTGVLQIFSIFLCIAAPCFFFSELARLATKTGVSCGSIKLPAFWFTVLVAVGISSMFVLATLVMSYTRWRLSNGKVKPRVGDVDDAILEGLHEVLQG